MKTSSCKNKGRLLQKYVVGRILHYFTSLSDGDISSRSMGAGGEDILLSTAARKILPISIECKSKKAIAIYKDYSQAKANATTYEPILIVKQNGDKPLAIINLEYLLNLLEEKLYAEKAQATKET